MPKTKEVNYSQELTDTIVKAYVKGTSDDERAEILQTLSAQSGKTVRSLIAKLVREKVHVKKTYVAKTGKKAETKAAIVQGIAKVMSVTEDQLAGLENATKPTLCLLREAFRVAREALAENAAPTDGDEAATE